MRLWPKRNRNVMPDDYTPPSGSLTPHTPKPDTLPEGGSGISPPADVNDSDMRALGGAIIDLQRRVGQLERAQHGHCLGCGDTTGHYSQTHCGREDCEA